jgi:UDP-N-acetyl-D-mannosaminuronic acid transferase (WecB/TagA/CpsF family)
MKTAVEWLQSQFENTDDTELVFMNIEVWFKIAKEMEKKQIIDAHGSKLISPKGLASEYWVNGEEYYNKTFNKGQ